MHKVILADERENYLVFDFDNSDDATYFMVLAAKNSMGPLKVHLNKGWEEEDSENSI